jgi:elongator complex protein 1
VERGARLVTATPTSLSLVLQMPRGNLETIWPRAMVVAGIRKLIEEKNYRKAFLHCRTQRVDMNLLYDHAPEQFMANVALFVDQIKKVTYIDLFLSALREEDVTEIMYKETRVVPKAAQVPTTNATEPAAPVTGSKVNRICDALLEVLQTRQATNLQNIITANVCKSPPALDDGLLVVARLMGENETLAEQAVEHICFLADVNKLYDNALGLYNLDLTLMVAQQSQKDPREYLPFMQNLQQMSELRRRFSIDDYLNRNTKALAHLHEMDVFDELCAYTVKHDLYKSSLSLYRYKPTQLNAIMALYAAHLENKSNHREAGIAYEYLHDYARATSNYQSASMWQEALFTASLQTPPLSSHSISELATSLADALYESKDYLNAATIQLDYNADILSATRTFCKGYHFATAMRLCVLHKRPELLEEVVDPALADALASSTELLADCKAQLQAQVPRIRELRAKALADPLAFYEGVAQNEDIPDDVSVAASSRLSTAGGSLFTRYTNKQSVGTAGTGVTRATSKNRRREERKRARGKKGSVYEEEYLVNSVGRLIERVESVREEIERLVLGLLRRGMRERAVAVENQLAEVVAACKACIAEVYGEEKKEPEVGEATIEGVGGETWRVSGADAVVLESMEDARKKKVAPVIGAFEKLSLLGA